MVLVVVVVVFVVGVVFVVVVVVVVKPIGGRGCGRGWGRGRETLGVDAAHEIFGVDAGVSWNARASPRCS